MAKRKQRGIAGDKTICLPIAEGIDYEELVEDREVYREYLDTQIASHPELSFTKLSNIFHYQN